MGSFGATRHDAFADDLALLDAEWDGEQAEWERDGQEDDFQNAVHRDSDDAEREQQEPDKRIRDESQQGEGPAEDEEQAPEEKCEHGKPPSGELYV